VKRLLALSLAVVLALVLPMAPVSADGTEVKLTASDGAANDYFGYFISISGDTAVVGAWQDDGNKGSAYVFVRSGATWSQQAKLVASDGAGGDQFGQYVSISGDTVVVGALYDDFDSKTNAGSAYVFVRSGTTWSQQQKLTASDGAADDHFGTSVSISGDTVVVGAHWDDSKKGSAYVFVRSGTTWSQEQKLTSGSVVAGQFGISVSISGDTAVVGAEVDDGNEPNSDSGAAYVFIRNGDGWDQEAKLTASDGVLFDYFGGSVSISGDTVVVGARGADVDSKTDAGSAYVYGERLEYTLTISIEGEGDVDRDPSPPYYQGDDTEVTLTATPDTGWAFDHWEDDITSSTNPIDITMDGDKTVTAVFTLNIEIDIKPGSEPNSINPGSKGVIPVAILTTGDFDAASVNVTTVLFGKEGNEAAPVHYALEDVDDDGDIDMILHFKTQETGIGEGDTEATLTGQTLDGKNFKGTDAVRIVPPKGKKDKKTESPLAWHIIL